MRPSHSGFSDAFYKANREKYDPETKPDACWRAKGTPVPAGIETNGAFRDILVAKPSDDADPGWCPSSSSFRPDTGRLVGADRGLGDSRGRVSPSRDALWQTLELTLRQPTGLQHHSVARLPGRHGLPRRRARPQPALPSVRLALVLALSSSATWLAADLLFCDGQLHEGARRQGRRAGHEQRRVCSPHPLAPPSRRTAADVAFPAYDPSRFARMYRAQAGDGKGGVDDDWEM
jgi:hypothetical protein